MQNIKREDGSIKGEEGLGSCTGVEDSLSDGSTGSAVVPVLKIIIFILAVFSRFVLKIRH